MSLRSIKTLLPLVLVLLVTAHVEKSAAAEAWATDVISAIKQATQEDKDLLLFYTGSDWCPPCKKLVEEVLANEEFQFEISKHFVLVKFDFPQSLEQDEKLKTQNKEWAEKYGIEGYPTLILVDKELKPYAITGYEEGGFENYLALLEENRQLRVNRDEKLKSAKGTKGLKRAKLLDEAVNPMREDIVSLYYPEIVKEIVALDKSDELGLRSKWNASQEAEMRKIIMTDVMMISKLDKPERAIEFIDEILGEIKFPANQQLEILQMKLNLVRQLDDPLRVDRLLDDMISLEGVEGQTQERLIVKKIYLMIGSGRDAAAMKLLEESMDGPHQIYLAMAKGEILSSKKKYKEAIEAFDIAIQNARNTPDLLIDCVSAKADALYALELEAEALQTLDNFADDKSMPSDLRAEALLHKAMIMRDRKRIRTARLAENRAIEISGSPQQRAEMQKIVDALREKYEQ